MVGERLGFIGINLYGLAFQADALPVRGRIFHGLTRSLVSLIR